MPRESMAGWSAKFCACDCLKCHSADPEQHFMRFIACPICGNKRCPKATDHELACSGSNDSGQIGSFYE